MKKLLTIALTLAMLCSLCSCGDTTESTSSASGTSSADTSQSEASTTTTSDDDSETPEATTTAATTAAASGEVMDFDIGITAVPAEWQKAIGSSMFGMNTGAGDDYSDSYLNKFGGVTADDFAKLIAYFDTLSYTEKLDGVYNCDWGQLQIAHNADASEMTISWYAN